MGLTTAALASIALLTENASAAPPQPSIAEVKAKVDDLYQQAEVATERFNGAKEKTDQQRAKADLLLSQVAKTTDQLNEARRVLGQFATAQYRSGGIDQTAALLLSPDPEKFLDQSHLMDRLSWTQQQALKDYRAQQEEVARERSAATQSLAALTEAQAKLATEKKNVQAKLAEAQKLLNSLTAQERARLDELNHPAAQPGSGSGSGSGSGTAPASGSGTAPGSGSGTASGSGSGTGSGGSTTGSGSAPSGPTSTRAAQAIAFARAQLGKPYISGATGPDAYDCSGLTQAAWRAAGISLGRTTWDQIDDGTRIPTSELRPGDLVFFYSGISHVAIYIGDGKIIHAPHPGGVVEVGQMSWMPVYGAVRPG